jgi:hypothetical protein
MQKIKITKNPYLFFVPFLIISIIYVLIFPTHGHFGDEPRYLLFAKNLLHGYYSRPAPDIDIGNGPGYSILLMPFVFMRLPLVSMTILNAIFYYLSIVLIYKTIVGFVGFRKTIVFCLFWAFYINLYMFMPKICNETFSTFLISLIAFCIIRSFNNEGDSVSKKYIILSGVFIGYLALTKPIFGFVLLFLLIGNTLLWIFNRSSQNYRKSLIIILLALLTNAPYLIYTYNLSGKIFYWSSFGGDNLYWMSTPNKNEYGSWNPLDALKRDSIAKNYFPGDEEYVKSNYRKDFHEISKYKGIDQDDVFKRLAINNIKSHPIKFVQNCICNIGRILFDIPYSYTLQSQHNLICLPFNGLIVVLILFCMIPTYFNWKKIPFSIRFLIFFILIYLGGSVLGSAETRMFTHAVPIILIWIAYIIKKWIVFKPRFD